MTVFLFALAGIPPLGGWFAKFEIFYSVVSAGTTAAYILGGFVAVNSVIALFYYANVARQMWMQPVPDGDRTPIRVPFSLSAALTISIPASSTKFFTVEELVNGITCGRRAACFRSSLTAFRDASGTIVS